LLIAYPPVRSDHDSERPAPDLFPVETACIEAALGEVEPLPAQVRYELRLCGLTAAGQEKRNREEQNLLHHQLG
jgi:hypothetical protein